MFDASHPASCVFASTDTSSSCCCNETLVQLLAAATAAFDSDHDAARICIQRAAELLQVSGNRKGYRRNESPVLRGGLAPWQVKRAAAYIEVNIISNIRVADLAGITKAMLSAYETGRQLPSVLSLVKILAALGISWQHFGQALAQVSIEAICSRAGGERDGRRVHQPSRPHNNRPRRPADHRAASSADRVQPAHVTWCRPSQAAGPLPYSKSNDCMRLRRCRQGHRIALQHGQGVTVWALRRRLRHSCADGRNLQGAGRGPRRGSR